MLELANHRSEVPIEESNGTIRNLLCILYGIGRDIPVLTTDEMLDLLNVADKYDILHVADYIALKCHTLLQNIGREGGPVAFHILCLAARLDDPALAKSALQHLNHPSPLEWTLEDVTRLGLRYYLGVIHAWHALRDVSTLKPEWERASQRFAIKD
jgi:hypothetical protein